MTAFSEDEVKEKLEAMKEENEQMTKSTMSCELLQLVLDEIKAMKDVWQKLSQDDQDDFLFRARERIDDAVEKAVHTIASEGRKVIAADVEQVVFKDGIKAVIKVRSADPNRHELADSVNMAVLVVVGGAENYKGGMDDVKSDPQQTDLIDHPVSIIGNNETAH